MNGIRVDIMTGVITQVEDPRVLLLDTRQCLRCGHNFNATKKSLTKYCSISCSKKGQNNRLGTKHTEETKAKLRAIAKITRPKRIRKRKPHFVKDELQWANRMYGRWCSLNREPHQKSDDYGLYKYGEWLFHNTKYSIIIPYEKTQS